MPTFPTIFKIGNTYVGMGFVDHSDFLFGNINGSKEKNGGPMKFIGVSGNSICAARGLIISEMMKLDKPPKEVFELWYLSCISQ